MPICRALTLCGRLHLAKLIPRSDTLPAIAMIVLFSATREKLKAWGGPYIIENVVGAPLVNPVRLCGSSFGLEVRRHRIFESNIEIAGAACRHETQPEPIDVSGQGYAQYCDRKKKTGGKCRKPFTLSHCRQIMDMPWASRLEIAQAIPPAFSEFLGRQIMRHLKP